MREAQFYPVELLLVCLCERGRKKECKAKKHGKVWTEWFKETSKARAIRKAEVFAKKAGFIGEHVRAIRVLDSKGGLIWKDVIKAVDFPKIPLDTWDCARLDWLEKNPDKILCSRLPGNGGRNFIFRFLINREPTQLEWSKPRPTMRECIDAAMREGV